MNRNGLAKIKRAIANARRASVRAANLEGFAKRLGRKKRKGKNGGEPLWDSEAFDDLYPLAIPHHGGRDLAPGTKLSILNQLEDEDVASWEQRLDDDENVDEPDEDEDEGASDATG